MRSILALALAGALWLPVSASAQEAETEAPPEVGDRAPAFELVGSDGEIHRLADHVGKRGVVIAWFPRAFTPG